MPVDDAVVKQTIRDALAHACGPGVSCCDRVKWAFRPLQAQRQQPGNSLDLNLAAAEHYMFARWMVCTGRVGPFQMRLLVRGYDMKKRWDRMLGDPDREAVTANPVSPPDEDVRAWGLRGVTDGETDPQIEAPLWRPLEEVFGRGRGIGPY
jgi:hypothetical protein